MKIITVLGARPQFIKAGSVSREIAKYNELNEVIIHTGQHYDANMSDIFFDEMHIPRPKYHLSIGGKNHGAMTGQMMEKIEEIALIENPDLIMVYGDTNSTLAGALVASKLHIKLAHIEAGLRSFNMQMPEEINRILTDRVSNLLFCPTINAVQNLRNEGFDNFTCKIIQNGDVMQDGALFYKQFARKPKQLIQENFILCTIHRAENTDNLQRLRSILVALIEIGKEIQIILPLHPRTRNAIDKLELKISNIMFIEPLGYLEMVWLIEHSNLVITDSGGLQKEAYFFKKTCLTLRDETEWVELVDIGVNQLVGTNTENILYAYRNREMSQFSIEESTLYGDGHASEKIIKELIQ